jgi:hypothetical protein
MRVLRFTLLSLAGGLLLGACGASGWLDPEDCEDANGYVIIDPGDGSSHREGCPAGEELLGSVEFGIEGGICCRR